VVSLQYYNLTQFCCVNASKKKEKDREQLFFAELRHRSFVSSHTDTMNISHQRQSNQQRAPQQMHRPVINESGDNENTSAFRGPLRKRVTSMKIVLKESKSSLPNTLNEWEPMLGKSLEWRGSVTFPPKFVIVVEVPKPSRCHLPHDGMST
jgi:hypothetical protein